MNNKLLGTITISIGLLIFFAQHEKAWIVSAVLLGVGSGIFFLERLANVQKLKKQNSHFTKYLY